MADFAYLSGGRLFVEVDGGEARPVESAFADAIATRAASIARRNEWKTQGRGARFQRGLEGIPDELLEPRLKGTPVRFTGLGRGRHPAEFVYTLSTGAVSGLFAFSGGEEERLFHSSDVHVSEPACDPNGQRFACVMRGKDGVTHIGLLVQGEPGVTQLTVGDAMDSAPCWAPGEERLLYESRAFGYDKAGRVVDIAASTIQELDLKGSALTTVVAIEGMDCSAPHAELVARGNDGQEQVIATRVVCFDIYRDGSVVWSDGRSVSRRTRDGNDAKLGKQKAIGGLVAIDGACE